MENKTILLIAGIIVIVAVLVTYVNLKTSQPPLGYVGSTNTFVAANDNTDNSSAWIGSTANATIAKNPSRQFCRITVVPYSTSTVWLWQNTSTDLVVTGKGIPLNSSTTNYDAYYQIDGDNLYRGEIQLISEGNTKVSWICQP